jgi:hypothetical protein
VGSQLVRCLRCSAHYRRGDPSLDPFDAPEDYADPWRGREVPTVGAAVVLLALIVVLLYLA